MHRANDNLNPHDQGLLISIAHLAIEAGKCIMKYRDAGFATELKGDQSPVTEADKEAEKILEAGLKKLLPNTQIIGEEATSKGLPASLDDTFFLLDPLDGTREFINNKNDFTVNIGLIQNKIPVAGIIYAPARKELYLSGKNSAFMNHNCNLDDRPGIDSLTAITVNENNLDAFRVVASRSHRAPETDAFIEKNNLKDIVSVGSSLKFCLLAAGEADIYPRHGRTMEWDTAAGHAILRSAGGCVTQLDGMPLLYGKIERGLDNPYFIAHARQTPQIKE